MPRQIQPVLHGTSVTLRPVAAADVERLTEILQEEEVARWWPRYDATRVRAELIDQPSTVAFAVEGDGVLLGAVLYVEEPSPDYRHASIDVFLTAERHGGGLGTDAVRTLARHLVHDRGHHRLAIDPAAANERAIRAAKRVGFRPVGVMRAYERGVDGAWQDGLLMDLLADELV